MSEHDLSAGLFQVYSCPGVVIDHCVIVKDRQLLYAGPLGRRPTGVTPADIYVNPDDFALVRAHMRGIAN